MYRDQGITVAYKSNNTIKGLLGNPKDKIEDFENRSREFMKLKATIVTINMLVKQGDELKLVFENTSPI